MNGNDGKTLVSALVSLAAAALHAATPAGNLESSLGSEEYVIAGESPAVSPRDGRIAFQRYEEGVLKLGVCEADGSGLQWVEPGPGMAAYPTWSPSGALVYTYGLETGTAYEVFTNRMPAEGYGLKVWENGRTRILTSGYERDYLPTVSPDGQWVYFTTTRGVKSPSEGYSLAMASNIARIPLDGSGEPEILLRAPAAYNAGVAQPVLSPDGKTLLWAHMADFLKEGWTVCSAPVDGLGRERWKRVVPMELTALSPRWHPSGRAFGFTGYREGDDGWGVWVSRLDDGRARRLADGENPAFSSDGRFVYYDRNRKIYRKGLNRRSSDAAAVRRPFEMVALVDSLDFARYFDVEKPDGNMAVLERVLQSHATDVWWRDKGGGRMRYPSRVEGWPLSEYPFDRHSIPCEDIFGHLRLDAPSANVMPLVRAECRRRGIGFGIHTTFEETHDLVSTTSGWTLNHPQYWGCVKGDKPWLGCCAMGYEAVIDHKLAMLDERLEFSPGVVFLDFWRCGGYSLKREYVKPVVDEWRRRYGCEVPAGYAEDPRWIGLVSERMMAYLRAFSRKCHAAGARFAVGFKGIDATGEWILKRYGVDWPRLAAEGVLDAVVVMAIRYDAKDPWNSTEKTYRAIVANRGKADVYFPLAAYEWLDCGFLGYARTGNVSAAEASRKLLELARDAGGRGAVMECVDYENYPPDVCQTIRGFLLETSAQQGKDKVK